jgi:hypothetical protein
VGLWRSSSAERCAAIHRDGLAGDVAVGYDKQDSLRDLVGRPGATNRYAGGRAAGVDERSSHLVSFTPESAPSSSFRLVPSPGFKCMMRFLNPGFTCRIRRQRGGTTPALPGS